MTSTSTLAERLDRAVEQLAAGATAAAATAAAGLDADGRRLVDVAARLRASLLTPAVAPRFEARLGSRLSGAMPRDPVAWALRHPGRLIVTGAVGSVGVGVTAYAVWRTTRRAHAQR